MAAIKPIILYGSAEGLSPWKVVIIINELNIPYKLELLSSEDMAKPEYQKICANGRVPAIEDPNTGVTLWESGAVIEYLVETYDKEHSLNYASSERFQVKQWLHFHVTGQAPSHGEAWFYKQNPGEGEKAMKRYQDEVVRVVSVLDKALGGREYLVGDKCTLADLAFVPWASLIPYIFGEEVTLASLQLEEKYPAYSAWYKATSNRPSVQKMFKDSQAAMAAAA
ncbi:Hypothetical protein NCS54_01094200 [Fusarium falciforme]|uniref:Hypothetical protein n=1 Tax=Fusarium falciforme TaxID=195108 RepID=UPI00230044AC|nr:Hypothetical protein NCS54_01094200 [Fusarium falciforme]WAO93395.1 Hypothetical protein NCS54_01094200 [Fusarium falciforme]